MEKNKFQGLCLLFVLSVSLPFRLAAQDFPEKPYPPRLVNDFAGMLNGSEINSLESKLVAFNDSTSTQIAIVTVSDLMGYEVADFAQRLAEKWGIGQKGLDNGILILVKPKTEGSLGQVSIAPGYGLEGAIPDLICARIIDNEILPAFREGDFYGGLDKASTVLMQLASGEFTADEYGNSGSDAGAIAPFIIFVIFLIIFMLIRSSGGRNQKHLSNKGLPLWVLLSMMNSGSNSHKGSWGGFSGGSGGRGFGGGGGFGGGSFGGGGASGSW
ncbi:MAG TPA: TPM domain-containing protein [Bacteroidales bacterium]|nr:TPM domain-containing protein [Bacteroidales bacterium]HOX73234.1 TPM domain-containing protein [Bacteroidales bacterium]HPM86465.1 TPM domain-containing protein [Bacteroidales bacterium]HQM68156.1 TPM domain-containing protein [Bacteroidales bacterium]